MAKDIQIKYINDIGEWEDLNPATKTRLITDNDNNTIESLLSQKANTDNVYNRDEVYNKEETYTQTETDTLLNDLEQNVDIPVTETEPTDSDIWFEVI